MCYCVQESNKNHCLWLMDEKLQIWKCYNELISNSCDWTLTKVTNTFDNLYHKRFLKVSMNYDDYFVTTSLSGMKCLHSLALEEVKQHEFLFAFNETSQKCVIVKQQTLKSFDYSFLGTTTMGQSAREKQIMLQDDEGMIQMLVVCKNQQTIMNRILELRGI